MTKDDLHLTLAGATFFFVLVSPIIAAVLAVVWLLFALLIEDYNPEV